MMRKNIYDVFNGLQLSSELNDCFKDAQVSTIVMSKSQGVVSISLVLTSIVHPKLINELAETIFSFFGYPTSMEVHINESYELPFALSFKDLYTLYEEQMLYYIRSTNPICAMSLKTAKKSIGDDEIIYEIPVTAFSYMKDFQVESWISGIFKEKFNVDVEVKIIRDDQNNHIYEEFIRNRDIEQKHLLKRRELTHAVEEKVVVAQEDITKETYENLIYGKKPAVGEIMLLKNFDEDTTYANIDVCVISTPDARELRGGKYIYKFDVTDYTDSITCKLFVEKEEKEAIETHVKTGEIIRIRGNYKYDDYDKTRIFMVNTLEKVDVDLKTKRLDKAEVKRVELHLHTQMSDMDGVMSVKDAVKQAIKWGHKAIAITDHGVVQAYPDAFHAAEKQDIKIIYGVEAYLVDDQRPIVQSSLHGNIKEVDFKDTFVVFDIETTGFRAHKDKITEFGAVKINKGVIVDRFSEFVNPRIPIPQHIQDLTHITNEMVKDAEPIELVFPKFIEFCGDAILVAQNADFDMSFIAYQCNMQKLSYAYTYVDTLEMARRLLDLKNYKLNTIAEALEIRLVQHHRAVYDAETTAEILIKLFALLEEQNVTCIADLIQYSRNSKPNYKKLRPTHCILLCANREGLRNMYKLISYSHIDTFYKKPLMTKSMLDEHREGLIVGSACEAGDLYPLILEGRTEEAIKRVADFYDYFEIQPTGNNAFMVAKEKVSSLKEIEDTNKAICMLGETLNKLVVATCDVHFLNKEDEIYRRILMAGKGFPDADDQAPLFYRTTNEMLDEFMYLGEEKAYEVVVTNTNLVADQIARIEPVEKDKYPPKIEGAEKELEDMCYEKAKLIYGDPLPYVVEERLSRELNSIISNGFAVMYIIAQKLVKKSNDDGYLVGSRGSVGSSFAATMSGITEVNPLQPHYICEACQFSDFDSDEVRKYAGNSGVDMPDRNCPNCGTKLLKEGHDIPFETFLGFQGNKEPDIDLNFSGEYQSKAHEYTEVLFGKGHVFRAGTIGTLADKTAYGFVKNYFDEREMVVKEAEINRIIQGCVGVRRTSGQHPGGIIVVPKEQEIYTFTPIQKPANDQETNVITTHFDYHSIDHNLLKLDILGHDDPTMIRFLEDLTGVNATKIPLDEPKVMSLFLGLEALNISSDDIGGIELGSLGIPEFGTDFVIQMLVETAPKSFSDLIRISGLSHGTDVWSGNAQTLIKEGKATISTCISTRDDIMTYLIGMGMDKELSFTIMESVRKGKGLKPDWEKEMRKANVPEWYIWSCNTIKYMFPKAHAAAYVMMAYRIAYFKVYHPIQYYTAFFSIRAANFDYLIMCKGKANLLVHMADFKERYNDLTKKEKDMIKDMRIVQEMYVRGFDFMPIDLYCVHASHFQIFDGRIMPSLSSINGMGEKAAESIIEARKNGEFISIEDFRIRTKTSKTMIDLLKNNDILKGLPDTNQISLF
jgi:DNA polymerase III subunit alpha, Gram-positive type